MIYVLFLVGVGLGFAKKMPRAYWFALAQGVVVNLLGGFLFSAGGTLQDPNGDGLVTHWIRVASNDGPAVLLALPLVIVFVAVSVWLPHRAYKAELAKRQPLVSMPNNGPQPR